MRTCAFGSWSLSCALGISSWSFRILNGSHSQGSMEISCCRSRYISQRRRRGGSQRSSSTSRQRSMELSCCRSSYISPRRRRGSSQRSASSSSPRTLLTAGVSLAAAAISWVLARMQVLGGGPTISSSIRCSI